MSGFSVELPIRIGHGRKSYSLNFNQYHNWHPHLRNDLKKAFTAQVLPLVRGHRIDGPVRVVYALWYPQNRELDIGNICFVVDKFFLDTLVEAGCIPDDNCTIVKEVVFRWGGVDRDRPRVDATVEQHAPSPTTPTEPLRSTQPVKIIVEKSEVDLIIQQAIQAHIRAELNLRPDQHAVMTETADGYEVKIVKAATQAQGIPDMYAEAAALARADLTAISPRQDAKSPAFAMPYGNSDAESLSVAAEALEKAAVDLGAAPSTSTYLDTAGTEEPAQQASSPVPAAISFGGAEPVVEQAELPEGAVGFDADGNPVDDERFVGKTWKQIAGIKGADARKAREAAERENQGNQEQEAQPSGLVPPMDNVPAAEIDEHEAGWADQDETPDQQMDRALDQKLDPAPDPTKDDQGRLIPSFMRKPVLGAPAQAEQEARAPVRPDFLANRPQPESVSQPERAGISLFPSSAGTPQPEPVVEEPVRRSPRLIFGDLGAPGEG